MRKLAPFFLALPLLLAACGGSGELDPPSISTAASNTTTSTTTTSSAAPSATTTEPSLDPEPSVSQNTEVQPQGFVAPQKQQPEVEIPAPAPAPEQEYVAPAPSASYANCSEARAAGVAPLYTGDPGYSTKLDRDRDGIACE